MEMRKPKLLISIALATAALIAAGTSPAQASTFGDIASPGVYYGTGNSNGNWTIDTAGGVEVALRAKARFTGGVLSASNGFYDVASGASSGKAMWNYDFSVNTLGSGLDLPNYTVQISIDTDPTAAVSWTSTFDITHWTDNAYWNGSVRTIGGTLAGEFGAQNSENPSFGDSGFGYVPGPGLYDFQLSVLDANSATVASTTMQINVVPEPETYAMLLAGLGLLGFMARRRKQKEPATA